MLKLSNETKKRMAEELNEYREALDNFHAVKIRLRSVPISYTRELFNISFSNTRKNYFNNYVRKYPCNFFGRQLVHKIIDELLDTGDK